MFLQAAEISKPVDRLHQVIRRPTLIGLKLWNNASCITAHLPIMAQLTNREMDRLIIERPSSATTTIRRWQMRMHRQVSVDAYNHARSIKMLCSLISLPNSSPKLDARPDLFRGAAPSGGGAHPQMAASLPGRAA